MASPDIHTVAYKRIFLWTSSRAAKLEFKEPPGPCTIWIFEVAIEHGRHLCCIFISEAIEFRFELDG